MIPRVSVVLPFKDAATWLPTTLASLVNQQGIRYELVAVDDRSRDGSAALLQRCWMELGQPAPLRLLSLPGAGGVSAARNAGWRAARAPLVAFLDADDLCLGQRLALQAERLEREPQLGQVLCGWRRFSGGDPEDGFAVRPWLEGAGFTPEQAFLHKAVLPSAWMLRREVLERLGGFDPALSQAEDVDLLLRLALAGVRGAWLEQMLCGYRVHPGGVSRQLRPQAEALQWVLRRQLRRLPSGHPLLARQQELLLGCRSWSAWAAWQQGDGPLALELWRSAWGASPLGPARTWVHLAQAVEAGSARQGSPFNAQDLLADPAWQGLEQHAWRFLRRRQYRRQSEALAQPQASAAASHQRGWTLLVHGFARAGLTQWRRQLAAELEALQSGAAGPSPGPSGACTDGPMPDPSPVPWAPAVLLLELAEADDPVLAVRRRALQWCEALLGWDGTDDSAAVAALLEQLAELLAAWAALSWEQNGEAALARLEQAFALWPDRRLLPALARLYRSTAPTGAAALEQLARHAPQEDGTEPTRELDHQSPPEAPAPGIPDAPADALVPPHPPSRWPSPGRAPARGSHDTPLQRLAQLPEPLAARHRCRGPGCPDCGLHSLGAWERQPLAPGCELWSPPFTREPDEEAAAELIRLEGGRAWLRPPLRSPWGTTTAVTVADRDGRPIEALCRAYPQAWPGCLEAERSALAVAAGLAPGPPPPPSQTPLRVEGPVLAVADLSAEIHYHWLLEQLPRLGLALQRLEPAGRQGLRLWHNGGDQPARLELLRQELGLEPGALIDARRHPHIAAEWLLVPPFSGRFGWPAVWAQRWLRQQLLPSGEEIPAPGRRRLWLHRGRSPRRPVWGEAALLRELERQGLALEAVDLGALPLRRQARLLAEAELVVAPHGGAMAALVFAGPGTRVLELHQPRYAPPYFHGIVQERQLRYARCEQPLVAPCLYQELVYEGPLVEPIVLDSGRCVQALQALIQVP